MLCTGMLHVFILIGLITIYTNLFTTIAAMKITHSVNLTFIILIFLNKMNIV